MIITKKGPIESTIQVEESFRAPRTKVFKAWTNPESLKKWFLAAEDVVVDQAKVDLKVGGEYFINAIFPGFDPIPISGKFILVDIDDQLQYSWLTPALNGRMTKVEVHFEDEQQGSKIVLTHGEFKNEEEMQLHIDGWKACLRKLHQLLNQE